MPFNAQTQIPQHSPETVATLCHVCLFYHFEANGTAKAKHKRGCVECKFKLGSETFPAGAVMISMPCKRTETNQTKSLLLSSYEFRRPLYKGAWWRVFFLLPEDEEGLLRDANPPRDEGTAAKVGTARTPSPAAARVRVGTTFPELLPLLVTALLPPPPFVFPLPPVLLLLVLGTELAPPGLCCGRPLDITQRPDEKLPEIRCVAAQSIRTCCYLAALEGLGYLASWLACVLASWEEATVPEHPACLTCPVPVAPVTGGVWESVCCTKSKRTGTRTRTSATTTALLRRLAG